MSTPATFENIYVGIPFAALRHRVERRELTITGLRCLAHDYTIPLADEVFQQPSSSFILADRLRAFPRLFGLANFAYG